MSDALRTAYGDVVNEPVPDNLKHLIQTIRQKSAGK
ncbi:NepR family anti-sigma factor [Hyphomonas johnsonii]|nr:NepR family anti-sigma factor [Hyphomonas johnsonii]